MKILISGSSGLVGSALVSFLTSRGHQITRLVRAPVSNKNSEIIWDPRQGLKDVHLLEGIDGVIHLAGENLASGRWTPERRKIIRESRIVGTQTLTSTLAKLSNKPKFLFSASAVGYYGDEGDEILTEESPSGTTFLAKLCQDWEEATSEAQSHGIRVVHMRFGMILSSAGGALAKMLPPFQWGMGGVLGSGKQWMSWITLEDALRAIEHLLAHEPLRGPINVVSPQPVTNSEFTKSLGLTLRRPAFLNVPEFALRFAFGEMADEVLLASQRVEPKKLLESGFKFNHSLLRLALETLLKNL